jgi:3-deoxy-D-manno-octulosonate 8-phosphate phosphatase (KDO 8-P phosphatase)
MAAKRLSRPDLFRRLGGIRLLSLDVDGILTDGGLYFADNGLTLRKFNVKDGQGIKHVLDAGIEIAVISAGIQESIRRRMESLGIPHIFTGVPDKLEALTGLCGRLGIDLADVIHMGDDVNDLPVMEAVGYPITVPDAVAEVLDRAVYVTTRMGGAGAVREICDLLVAVRDHGD